MLSLRATQAVARHPTTRIDSSRVDSCPPIEAAPKALPEGYTTWRHNFLSGKTAEHDDAAIRQVATRLPHDARRLPFGDSNTLRRILKGF